MVHGVQAAPHVAGSFAEALHAQRASGASAQLPVRRSRWDSAVSCYTPLGGYRSRELTAAGRRRVVFNVEEGYRDLHVTVPCGKCIGCRTDKARDWSMRAVHEASLHEHSIFVTLTYSPEAVPLVWHKYNAPGCPTIDDERAGKAVGTLRPADFQGFMKRLRSWQRERARLMPGELFVGARFLQAGEYGKYGRPHHHALLFGVSFPDGKRFIRRGDYWLWRSATLERLWPHGFSSYGELTQASAQYVAQYTVKKLVAGGAQLEGRVPEYASMSRRPGLGRDWIRQYGREVYQADRVVVRDGGEWKPPAYYDSQASVMAPEVLAAAKRFRRLMAESMQLSSTERYAKEVIHRARLALRRSEL